MRILLCAFVALLASSAFGAAPPMQWSSAVTYYGPSSNSIELSWHERNTFTASRFEVRAFWLERPSRSPLIWKFALADVTRAGDMFSKRVKMPGAGTFTFEVRGCYPAESGEVCSPWASSLDAQVAVVRGVPGAWRVYFYVEPPGSVVPIP